MYMKGQKEQVWWPYHAVLKEFLPDLHSQSQTGITRNAGRHYVVVHQGRQVGAHRGEMTAIGKPYVQTAKSERERLHTPQQLGGVERD